MEIPVPPARLEERPWRQSQRAGAREDRMLGRIEVCIPARLADLEITVPAEPAEPAEPAGPAGPAAFASTLDRTVREISILDAGHGSELGALAGLLLRTESVASSKIELIDASVDDYARALFGSRANDSATAMVAASRAVAALMSAVDAERNLLLSDVLAAHSILLSGDPMEAREAGTLRSVQNWIGGSDFSPRGADYIPPPPDLVPGLVEDLLGFVRRVDVPIAMQAAIAHAQFELIHPFTDGNGRIGRALLNACLRLRGVTRNLVIPAASMMVARRDDYFASLTSFKTGDAGPIVALVTQGMLVAAQESAITAQRLEDVHGAWRSRLAGDRSARASGAPVRLLEHFMRSPVADAEAIHESLGGSVSRAYTGIERLHSVGIIEPLTSRKRNQIWAAREMLDELMDLDTRIQSRAQDCDFLSR